MAYIVNGSGTAHVKNVEDLDRAMDVLEKFGYQVCTFAMDNDPNKDKAIDITATGMDYDSDDTEDISYSSAHLFTDFEVFLTDEDGDKFKVVLENGSIHEVHGHVVYRDIYVYTEYFDEDAFDERHQMVFVYQDAARKYLKSRVEAAYGPWDEIELSDDDSLTEDHVSLSNGSGTAFYEITKLEMNAE